MHDWLDRLSAASTGAICVAFVLHLAWFALLWTWSQRDLRRMVATFDHFTCEVRHRSVLAGPADLPDRIDAFLTDVEDVLDDRSRRADRQALLRRMNYLDEQRPYQQSLLFETGWNVARTMIEAYPLAGILGTILAIGAALQTPSAPDSAGPTVAAIVARFGDAIWSTFAGLIAALVLMFVNGLLEPRFLRLAESRSHVRHTVARAKRELALGSNGANDSASANGSPAPNVSRAVEGGAAP